MKKIKYLLLFLFILGFRGTEAHSLPDSKAQLIVGKEQILIKFSTPLEISELAYQKPINLNSASSLDSLKQYYLKHISVTDSLKSKWNISIGNIILADANNEQIGNYKQIVTEIYLKPSNINSLTNFILTCDIVIHQVINQVILFSVEDWQNGLNKTKEIGVISWNIPTGKITPLKIQVEQISSFKSFTNMLKLGMQHISEGTDHLLFLFVLLLPASLLVNKKSWTTFGGNKYTLLRLLKLVTAFTIGHSITLLFGALGLVKFPNQPIEILIAVTILFSAIHAIKPIFAGKENYIALGFGLIHGLAFASTLESLHLETKQMIISILGFNIGIELMQILLLIVAVPVILMLSKTKYYTCFRVAGAVIGIFASVFWIAQRSNFF